jgi:hypothetical protein
MFKGCVIFVDHASDYVHVEPVVNFTAGETLRAKRAFEIVSTPGRLFTSKG